MSADTVRKPLKDLGVGHVVKTNEGRRRWFRIDEINAPRHFAANDYTRGAWVTWLGGRDAGQRVSVTLYHYPAGYEVQTAPVETPTGASLQRKRHLNEYADRLGALIGDNTVRADPRLGVILTLDQADRLVRLATRGKHADPNAKG